MIGAEISVHVGKLSVLQYADGFTHWLYKDKSLPTRWFLEGWFFKPVSEMVEDGDMVTLVGRDTVYIRVFHRDHEGDLILRPVSP